MSSVINTNNIKRNSNEFSFVDSLGSFIQNYEFSRGYDEYRQVSSSTKYSYIWEVLSSIGGNYAETIYENVLNYIDNVSNIDLCKVKNLQSIIKVLGIDYNIINDVQTMPIEIVNMIDILSINKHYLLDNKTFASAFIQELSSFNEGRCFLSASENIISNEISGTIISNKGGEDFVEYQVNPSDYTVVSSYLNNEKYYSEFLITLYRQILEKYVYLKYTDAENNLSSQYTYIYEYISDKLTAKNNQVNSTNDKYDTQIEKLKIKYKLQNFKQSDIVDEIENGNDYIEKYNQYQQEVLSAEMLRRRATYPYDKTYTEYESIEGYNLTRYSYYREKKVEEYFNFIENTYSTLIDSNNDGIKSILDGTSTTSIKVYDKDSNYFDINQSKAIKLLYYDSDSKQNLINTSYIQTIAELLAFQTIEISDIREQIKIQMRKSYLKGTFLLLSYIINEYLKYDISKNYGNIVYTQDEDIPLCVFIENYISNDNTELIEYYDETEYYNISSTTDLCVENELQLSILNKKELNSKFYDNSESLIGVTTGDIPLEEIDEFYRNQLKMKLNAIHTSSDLTNFLSLIYDYGANNSFLADRSDNLSSKFRLSGEYHCQVWNSDISTNVWLGDPKTEIEKYENKLDITNRFIDEVYYNISRGFIIHSELSVIEQLSSLSVFISNDMIKEISDLNESKRDDFLNNIDSISSQVDQVSSNLDDIWKRFEDIAFNQKTINDKYSTYISAYEENATEKSKCMKERIDIFSDAIDTATRTISAHDNQIIFSNVKLSSSLAQLSSEYLSLEDHLSNLIENYVKEEDYWPYYQTRNDLEITSQTDQLASYLQSKIEQIKSSILQHQQNHLTQLLTYKNEVLNMWNIYTETSSMFDNFKQQIFAYTNTDKEAGSKTFKVWTAEQIIINPKNGEYWKKNGTYVYDAGYLQNITVDWPAIPETTIPAQLQALNDRCNTWFYYQPAATKLAAYVFKGDTWYVNGAYTTALMQKWATAWSAVTAADITAKLEQLVEKFPIIIKDINIELACLGENVGGIDGTIQISGQTTENIGDKIDELLKQLQERIVTLDSNYIQLEKYVLSDKFYKENSSKISRIDWIVSIQPQPPKYAPGVKDEYKEKVWNIKKINNEFYRINDSYEALKLSNKKPYLEEYPDTFKQKLSEQFEDLFNWMDERDRECKQEIQEKIKEIQSDYTILLKEFRDYLKEVYRSEVIDITDEKEYVIKQIKFTIEYPEYNSTELDNLIYIINGWLGSILFNFDNSALQSICIKIPKLKDYQEKISLIEQMVILLGDRIHLYLVTLTEVLNDFKEYLETYIKFIKSKEDQYNASKEIFLKYNGTDVGYDPFYNYKNKTHSSYQIHPYLYNFVEKSNLIYPLANTFFVAFSENYEKELVGIGLDNLIGKYGNIINLAKYGMFDWTGYQSQYERDFSDGANGNIKIIPDQYGFTGLFYPPALDEYLNDVQTFLQKVQENVEGNYYYKLGLSQEELNKITEQLRIYEKPIREIAQRVKDSSIAHNQLSTEYDIYKYTQDIYGNSLILLKSYKHLYEQHKDNPNYAPSYNEKKDTPGELWVRFKNHPIAFPAFDLRSENEELVQYETRDYVYTDKKLNSYIREANNYFSNSRYFLDKSLFELTKDSIQLTTNKTTHHLRCFFDIELSPDKQTLMLVTPMQTGTGFKRKAVYHNKKTFVYGNSNIIVGYIYQDYNYTENISYHTFSAINNKDNIEGITNNIDNISSPQALRPAKDSENEQITTIADEFVGFAKYNNYLIAVFAEKYWMDNEGNYLKSFVQPYKKLAKPYLKLICKCYNGSRVKTVKVNREMKYDILYKNGDSYKYANLIAITNTDNTITLGFASEEFQYIIQTKKAKIYSDDTTIVNFAEYTKTVEDRSELSVYGENINYPSNTALLQTTDSQHINIYNSFDSFTSYLVNVDLRFSGSTIVVKDIRYYNINTDIGYYPLFADKHGKSRFYINSALSNAESYNLELLGPENSDVDYTPVIIDTNISDQYGRVTEDYRDYNKQLAYSPELSVNNDALDMVIHRFDLRDVFVDSLGNSTYDELAETGKLLKYKWNLVNTSYTPVPIARGTLSEKYPTDNYYVSSSKYDLLSGQEIFGPNGISYQGIKNSNHIDNISAINLEVKYNDEDIPTAIQMSCMVDGRLTDYTTLVIPENKFQLLVYVKNSLNSYEFYRIIENAQSAIIKEKTRYSDPIMHKYENEEIDFSQISSLSDYTINGKYPFKDVAYPDGYDSKKKKYNQMSAMLEFKYSEQDTIDREFPALNDSLVDDEVIYMLNEDQYIYFFALDSFDTVSKDIFYMEKYDNSFAEPMYRKIKVNTISRKYQEFYDKSLTIQTTYNVENISDNKDKLEYGIVLYFNYKNFTDPQYITYKKRYSINGKAEPPDSKVSQSTSKDLANTYLRLLPGKSGRLDIRIDYVEYAKINKTDISQSIVGKETKILRSYYIMNISDDKPKFIVSRNPFKSNS